ncbi:MAG: helix-turn-helix domain-containing protein [Oscillibacter sp.]|nr:helix-turn-helix domain-containing protein [Oscillibacter sp.]
MDKIVDRVRSIIDFYGFSVRGFAKNTGINQQTLYKCINGRIPSVELLQKILSAYPDISAEWLLMGEGEMKKQNLEVFKEQLKEKDEQIRMLIEKISGK